MNRPAEFSGTIKRSYDDLKGWRYAVEGSGIAISDVIGGYTSTTNGLNKPWSNQSPLDLLNDAGGQTATTILEGTELASGFAWYISALNFQLDVGTIYTPPVTGVDTVVTGTNSLLNSGAATGYGDIAAGHALIPLQCVSDPTTLTVAVSGTAATYLAFLVEAVPQQIDFTETDDPNFQATGGTVPNSAVLPYWNANNPDEPLCGPGGTNPPTSQQSERKARSLVQFSANSGTPTANTSLSAAVGALVCDAGAVPLYIVVTLHGDAAINPARVWAVGLGTASPITGSLVAPFIRGFMQQHHLGVQGSAPKIDGGTEWKPLSSVDNNGQAFTDFSYLQAKTGIAPTVTAGSSPVSAASMIGNSSDFAGTIGITWSAGNLAAGRTVLANVTTHSGLVPQSIILTVSDLGGVPSGAATGVQFAAEKSGSSPTGWILIAYNTTGGNVSVTATSIDICYFAAF